LKNNNSERQSIIEQLQLLSEDLLSDEVTKFTDEALETVLDLVNNILEKERSGIDKMFESISQTLRYIPTFFILAITNKYIDPAIAARITAKLPLKQTISIAKGLSADYLGDAAVFMPTNLAYSILCALPRKNGKLLLRYMFLSHPMKVLDIFSNATKDLFKLEDAPDAFLKIPRKNLSVQRLCTLDEFIKYKK